MSSVKEKHWIDGSLYPDREVPESLDTLEDRIDFIARVCGAWDAEEWDILQHIRMTPEERQRVAAELRKRVFCSATDPVKENQKAIENLKPLWISPNPLKFLRNRRKLARFREKSIAI